MIDDPIVEEVRRIRQEYAARFNYDPSAIAEDLKKKRQLYAERLVSFPPKPAHRKPNMLLHGRTP